MDNLKISIITASYNQGQYIEEAINSIISQNYPDFEHIIFDNCSTDNTVEILKKYPHIIWKSEPDSGQSDALNKGFKMATGDLIGWLNADDKYLPHCFKTVSEYYKNHSTFDILYGDYRWINEKNEVRQNRKELDFDVFILKYLHVLYIPTTATFFVKKVFSDGNFLDRSLKYAMDYDFFLRLSLKNYKFSHIPHYLADFRWHDDSKSSQYSVAQAQEQYTSLLKHDEFLKKLPGPTCDLVRYFLMYLARGKRYYLKFSQGYYRQQWIK
ncbi:MAG: hypothetical protein N5P05_003576 [Chroococcopsis gigantea SAG 12.99]|jgi:glycosyltransferase involved in cell wall biosynthesis|nr:hypothetical protein [Chroococcopsis gigantea SAG 12.99]